MKHMRLTFFLTCSLLLSLSAIGQDCGTEITQFFTNIGTFTTTSLEAPTITEDVVITGSNASGPAVINVLNQNGLGVVGGFSDVFVDYIGSETIVFDFQASPGNSGNALGISFTVPGAGQDNNSGMTNGIGGDAELEVFGANGASLGIVLINNIGIKNVSSLFGNVPISRYTVKAIQGDFFRVESLTYTMECAPDPIPTMGQWGLFLLALMMTSLGLVFIRRKELAV